MLNKLKSSDFRVLRDKGKTFKTKNFLFVYRLSEAEVSGGLNFGITATRKVGKAFLRNRIKRLIKESLRLYIQQEGASFSSLSHKTLDLNIIVLRNRPEDIAFSDVQAQVQSFFTARLRN